MLFRPQRFLLNSLAALVVVLCATKLLNLAPGLQPGLAVPVVIPLLFVSMLEGRHFAHHFEMRPTPRTCWKVALSMFGLWAVCVALPVLAVVLTTSAMPPLSVLHALLVLSIVPALRIGYGLGIGPAHKPVRQPLL